MDIRRDVRRGPAGQSTAHQNGQRAGHFETYHEADVKEPVHVLHAQQQLQLLHTRTAVSDKEKKRRLQHLSGKRPCQEGRLTGQEVAPYLTQCLGGKERSMPLVLP